MEPRLLIVDDHGSFCALARLLLSRDGFQVVGEAADGATGITAARAVRPDVVLLDVQLPDMDGFRVARALTALGEALTVVLVSSRSREDYGDEVARSGARAFVTKEDLDGNTLRRVLGRGPGTGA